MIYLKRPNRVPQALGFLGVIWEGRFLILAQASRLGQVLSTSYQAGLGDGNNGKGSGSSLGFLVLVVS